MHCEKDKRAEEATGTVEMNAMALMKTLEGEMPDVKGEAKGFFDVHSLFTNETI